MAQTVKLGYSTYGKRPRDSQQAKITEACFALNLYRNSTNSVEEIDAFINEIMNSRWWKLRSLVKYEHLVITYNKQTACNPVEAGYTYRVNSQTFKIKLGGMTKVDALHTLAHFLHANDTPWHGREFARALLDLFIKYMTKDEVKELRKEFRERKIRTYAWTEEAKAGATERYVAKQYPKAEEGLLNILKELEAKGVIAE